GGLGTHIAALSRHFSFVHYLDAARSLADVAHVRVAEHASAKIVVTRASPSTLPYRDAAFDCVIWDGALEQGSKAARGVDATALFTRVLGECRRVIRPGGCLHLGIAVSAGAG